MDRFIEHTNPDYKILESDYFTSGDENCLECPTRNTWMVGCTIGQVHRKGYDHRRFYKKEAQPRFPCDKKFPFGY